MKDLLPKGNKGEWSEIYTLFRLLADGKIYAADDSLNKLENIYFPIIKIIRDEEQKRKEYAVGERISIYVDGEKIKELSAEEFDLQAKQLLYQIKQKSSQTKFELENTHAFMEEASCYKVSASAGVKGDINVQIYDINTGYSPIVSFSIKSQLGSPSTLLNASKSTNFIYKITPQCQSLRDEVNAIFKTVKGKNHVDLKGRIKAITADNRRLEYVGVGNPTFRDNLVLIDSSMDKIIAQTLLYFYQEGINSCEDMVEKLQQDNPMGYGNVNAYRYKFKKFLVAAALGMKPAETWDGIDEASGGYIIVTAEGDVLAYHIYNRDYFEEYLLKNTKYETPSTSRHEYGQIYSEDGEDFFKLNLQVRFKK